MRTLIISMVAMTALLIGSISPTLAEGKHVGFDTDTESTQGNGGKTNDNANPDNEGQTETTYEGPKGQLDKDNIDCNNCEPIAVDLPGKNR